MTDYQALVMFGHTPSKAAEIALDAKRGVEVAVRWAADARAVVSWELARAKGGAA